MKTESRFIRNISSNTLGFFLNVVIAFFLSPFVVHSLGDKIFGIWTLIVSLKGYYGLLDLGIRSAVGQYVTRYYAQNDIKAINRTLNTALAVITGVVVLILMVSGIVAWGAPQWFNLGFGDLMTIRITILTTGLTVALTFPAALFGIAMYARQRFDLQNLVASFDRILMAILTIIVLKAGFGLMGLAIVGFVTSIITMIINIILAFRLLQGLRISPQFISQSSLKELGHYGIFMFIINVADQIIVNLDAIVIGIFMTAKDITYYAIGANLIPYYTALVGAMILTITPYATSLDATGKKEALRSLWLNSSRGIAIFASLVAGGLFFVGKDFLKIWMGQRFIEGVINVSSADILKILTIAALIRLSTASGKQIYFAMRKVKFLACLALTDSLLNVVLSCIFVQKFGLFGVAYGTLISSLLCYGIILPIIVMKSLGVHISEFVVMFLRGGFPPFVIMFLMYVNFDHDFPVLSWSDFILKATIFTAPAIIIGILVGTTKTEKQAVLKKLSSVRTLKHE